MKKFSHGEQFEHGQEKIIGTVTGLRAVLLRSAKKSRKRYHTRIDSSLLVWHGVTFDVCSNLCNSTRNFMIAFAHGIRAQGETTTSLVTCLLPAVESSRAYRSLRVQYRFLSFRAISANLSLPFFFPQKRINRYLRRKLNFIPRDLESIEIIILNWKRYSSWYFP